MPCVFVNNGRNGYIHFGPVAIKVKLASPVLPLEFKAAASQALRCFAQGGR